MKIWFEGVVIFFVNVDVPCVGAARVQFFDRMSRIMFTLPGEEHSIIGGSRDNSLSPKVFQQVTTL